MKPKIKIIYSGYYRSQITIPMVKHVKKYLTKFDYDIFCVEGSFEIPFLIKQNINDYDGFIALGCIIRGETYHFELIANECAKKIMDLSIDSNKPIGFGILTCENLDQAIQRSDPNHGNKGKEAALACVRLINENKSIKNKLNG